MPSGDKKADLHLHSSFTDKEVVAVQMFSPASLFRKARALGMDYFCVSDHNDVRWVKDLLRAVPEAEWPRIIPAVEIYVRDPGIGHMIHVNAYMPHAMEPLEPDTIDRAVTRHFSCLQGMHDVDGMLSYAQGEQLILGYNHPFWIEPDEQRHCIRWGRIVDTARKFGLVELNASDSMLENLAVLALAERDGLALYAGSDSHTGHVGTARTMAMGNTAGEFMDNIANGRGRPALNGQEDGALWQELTGYAELLMLPAYRLGSLRAARHRRKYAAALMRRAAEDVRDAVDIALAEGRDIRVPEGIIKYLPQLLRPLAAVAASKAMQNPRTREWVRRQAYTLVPLAAKALVGSQDGVRRDLEQFVHPIILDAYRLRTPSASYAGTGTR